MYYEWLIPNHSHMINIDISEDSVVDWVVVKHLWRTQGWIHWILYRSSPNFNKQQGVMMKWENETNRGWATDLTMKNV